MAVRPHEYHTANGHHQYRSVWLPTVVACARASRNPGRAYRRSGRHRRGSYAYARPLRAGRRAQSPRLTSPFLFLSAPPLGQPPRVVAPAGSLLDGKADRLWESFSHKMRLTPVRADYPIFPALLLSTYQVPFAPARY